MSKACAASQYRTERMNTGYVKANMIIVKAAAAGKTLITAESCTGGLVAAALTDIAGSSSAFDRGLVTYSNSAKIELLGVPAETIANFGAVSAETARAMALGALAHSTCDIAVAITGVAGPGGGSIEKPVGLVHFACARRGEVEAAHVERRFGPLSRSEIRAAAVEQALDLFLEALR
jgi:nicotinamide-nucleotide amidase